MVSDEDVVRVEDVKREGRCGEGVDSVEGGGGGVEKTVARWRIEWRRRKWQGVSIVRVENVVRVGVVREGN